MTDIKTNVIHCGDNLEIMRQMPDESVDLIYLDPPFFSGRNYDVIWEGVNGNDHSEVRSFKDTEWYRVQCPKCDREVTKAEKFCSACGASLENAKVVSKNDIYAYIDWMVPRLREMHKILKPTGSIYLHADWHAVHYLKIEMDRIFGMKNYINEIIWHYPEGQSSRKAFGKKHDTILCYSKSNEWIFNESDILIPYTEKELSRYNKVDEDGKRFYWNKNRTAGKYKIYLKKIGKNPTDTWIIPIAHGNERLGYPTQKPEALLERIIKASSNPGDIVLDPFCGCGTAMAVAQKLGRRYIGIDVSPTACTVIAKRLHIPEWKIEGMPMTTSELAKMEPNEFQQWVCTRMSAENTSPDSEKSSGADGGIDGIVKSDLDTTIENAEKWVGALIQVKRQKGVGPDPVVKLARVMNKKNIKTGFVVALSFGKGAIDEAKLFKNEGKIEIILVKAEDIAEKGYFRQ